MPYDDEARPDTSVALSEPLAATRVSSGRNPGPLVPAVAEAALHGLLAPRKTLPPSLFYDEEGCRLFYQITRLPEYYLTRTEFSLLEATAPEVAATLPPGATLVEYGASDETKAEMLLRQVSPTTGAPVFRTYIPIDVAGPELRAMRDRLTLSRPSLTVAPVTADFLRPIRLPDRDPDSTTIGFFPGSTIGNLEPDSAIAFLHRAGISLGSGTRFLFGFDICRDPARLIPAYDDPAGVTARFNRNLLVRLNREAGASFDPETFAHRAIWNQAESRIEMHLVSLTAQTVNVAGKPIRFARGETIHTENSYKYAPQRMREMTAAAGWSVAKKWSDSSELFAIWLLD